MICYIRGHILRTCVGRTSKCSTKSCFIDTIVLHCRMIDWSVNINILILICNRSIFIGYMIGDFDTSCLVQSSHSCTWFCLPSHIYTSRFGNSSSIIFELNIVSWVIAMYQGFIFDLSKLSLLSFYCRWKDLIT